MCRRSSGRSGTMSVCDILLSNDEGRESRMENDGINKSKDDRILNGVCVRDIPPVHPSKRACHTHLPRVPTSG
jgi:hypothetical protein